MATHFLRNRRNHNGVVAPAGGNGIRYSSPPVEEQSTLPAALAYLHEGRGISIFLLGLLYLLLALSLDAAGWVESGMGLLVPVVLGAVAMGSLMAFSRFDGFFMISHSLSTGLAWVFYLMTRLVGDEQRVMNFIDHGVPLLQARAYFLLERWLEWVEAALNSSASNDNYVFILEISFLMWWLTYLGIWTVLRHGYVWRGIVMASIALLVNTYYAPQSVNGLMVIFFIVALLLLVWTNLIANQQRWRVLRIRFNPDISLDFMRDGVLYAVAVISLAFVAPSLGRNVSFSQLLSPINQRWESTTSEWNRLYQGINRQSRAVEGSFGRTLTLGGERNVGNRPVMQVQAATGRYWRAVAFDTYTGRQWINTASTEVRFDVGDPINNTNWANRYPLTQTVTLVAPVGSVLFAAPDVRFASVPVNGLTAPLLTAMPSNVEAAGQSGESELTWAQSRVPLEEGDRYSVVSSYAQITERDLRASSTDYPQPVLDRYLQLPEEFSPRVADLAREVAGSQTTVYDTAKALERFLRGFTYSEEISGPAPNQDPLEYFLFDVQEGYCDYYATSMATMLRSLGVPARTASGYAEGAYDDEAGAYIITERDAHTWVEVYFPGYGWVEFEPTAGESQLERPSGIELPDSSRPDDQLFDQQSDQPNLDPELDAQRNLDNLEEINQPFFGDGGSFQPSRRWIGTSVLLTLAALAAGWWLLRRRAYAGPDEFEAAPANLFYQRLLDWSHRLGIRGQRGQTPYERSALLSRHLPAGAALVQRITDIYVHYRYAPRRGGAGLWDDELSTNWKQLRPILWKRWLRKQLDSLRKEPVD